FQVLQWPPQDSTYVPILTIDISIENMHKQPTLQLRLKPRGFGRHHLPRIRNRHQALDGGWVQCEGHFPFAGVDTLLQFTQAADATDEVDALVAARVVDAQQRGQQIVLQDADIEAADGVVLAPQAGEGFELVPAAAAVAAAQVHGELVGVGGLGGGVDFADVEAGLDFLQELVVAEAVEVLDDAVVVEDVHLVVGEDHRGELVVGVLAGVVRVLSLAQVLDALGRRGAMVAVGDVEAFDLVELGLQLLDYAVVADGPEHVAGLVVGDEVISGLAGDDAVDQGVDGRAGAVGEEHGADLGAEGVDVVDAVIFLVGPGELVLLDQILFVGGDRGGGDQADLFVAAHHLFVDVEAGVGVALHDALVDELLQVGGAALVDAHVVGIDGLVDVDLGLVDAQKA